MAGNAIVTEKRPSFVRDSSAELAGINRAISEEKETAHKLEAHGPLGGLVGIDQEVVTLRGLSRQLRAPDRPASGGINP
jgi:hypothetical protein